MGPDLASPSESAVLDVDLHVTAGSQPFRFRLNAPAGGLTALFGPSGAGKTSLLHALAGLSRPDAGHIRLGGETLFDQAAGVDIPPERRRVGLVFQDARLFPHLSVADNLDYGARRAGRAAALAPRDAIISLLGLAPLLARRPAGLSGGEKQRVAIGRALAAAPQLLLLDEPMASLDAARKAEILPFLAGLKSAFDLPILLVTHDWGDVLRLADHLALLENGRVTDCGPLAAVAARMPGRASDGGPLLATIVEGRVRVEATTALVDTPLGLLTLDSHGLATGAHVRLSIAARDVMIALAPVAGVSISNQLAGSIQAITPLAGGLAQVRLAMGAGALDALITAVSAERLALVPGLPVVALIKAVTPNAVLR